MEFLRTFFIIVILSLIKADDYYELLGISKDADTRDIRRAFKKLALTMHPDKNPDDKSAHDKFIKVNRAYEVLKDEEMRKKYDLHGEAGLEDDFGKSWKGSYQSWNYYYESFGIYDDDPEVITLSKSDSDQSVVGSPDVWFINFYSPQCSHCHHLAPAWRAMARDLEGVVRIGAVNCEEDWGLCREQNIHSYPSLVLYPEKEKYRGSREADEMVSYILNTLPNKVIELTNSNLQKLPNQEEYKMKPWLISVCISRDECIFDDVLRKLGIILDRLVNIVKVDLSDGKKICEILDCTATLVYYKDFPTKSKDKNGIVIEETETKGILTNVLKLLPGLQELNDVKFQEIQEKLNSIDAHPWLIEFTKSENTFDSSSDTELKRLGALLPGVGLGHINCESYPKICSDFFVRKHPSFIIFKPNEEYEFHHGRFTAHDIATFCRESISSQMNTLSPKDFPKVTESQNPWFIDFFAPWCPPCMQLLPHFRRASRKFAHSVKFGTVDCTLHTSLCNKYNIRSYPTTILYNQSVPHQFHGSHSQKQLEDFVEDTLKPPVITLTTSSFEELVKGKSRKEMWVIDFFAPWCGPCQQLSPQWRKLAKQLGHDSSIHVGQVDCTKYTDICNGQGINSYPTIRLYPKGSLGIKKHHFYNGWNRDAGSLQAWVYSYLPSKVDALDEYSFNEVLEDTKPWIIDFYAPWCGHCQVFAPEFEKVAQAAEEKVKTAKVNCENLPHVCRKAGVRAYPTVLYYKGKKAGAAQNPVGEEIHDLNYPGVMAFIENKLGVRLKVTSPHDEL